MGYLPFVTSGIASATGAVHVHRHIVSATAAMSRAHIFDLRKSSWVQRVQATHSLLSLVYHILTLSDTSSCISHCTNIITHGNTFRHRVHASRTSDGPTAASCCYRNNLPSKGRLGACVLLSSTGITQVLSGRQIHSKRVTRQEHCPFPEPMAGSLANHLINQLKTVTTNCSQPNPTQLNTVATKCTGLCNPAMPPQQHNQKQQQ
jgi:hypothetical protein